MTFKPDLKRGETAGRYLRIVNTKFPLASTAALIADPARAAMLTALLNGRSLSASELARATNVSAQSASMHLRQLLEGGFLRVGQEGRHRYYCVANAEVAHAIESLGAISTPRKYRPVGGNQELCYARTCYDHLAGELAVQLNSAFESRGLIAAKGEREYDLTRRGAAFLEQWNIDVDGLRKSRRSFARRCLDWTERRPHLAGALGAAMYQKFLEFGWIRRDSQSRVVHVSSTGRLEMARLCSSGSGASMRF